MVTSVGAHTQRDGLEPDLDAMPRMIKIRNNAVINTEKGDVTPMKVHTHRPALLLPSVCNTTNAHILTA